MPVATAAPNPTAAETDPQTLGWMQGFPPPPDKTITFHDGFFRSFHGAWMARGVHGQGIYIDPKAEMVIARYASHPVAGNAGNDPVTLPAYMALARDLIAGG